MQLECVQTGLVEQMRLGAVPEFYISMVVGMLQTESTKRMNIQDALKVLLETR